MNYITTSHDEGVEAGAGYLYNNMLKVSKYRQHVHNHRHSSSPSGPDARNAGIINRLHPQAQFKIYNSSTGTYQNYNKDSQTDVFDEIIISTPRN